jgi:hypothetical protein
MSLQGHSGPYRTPFADYLSRSVTLVCDIHADFDRLVCLARALAIAKSFSRGSASIAIAAEFFWVSVWSSSWSRAVCKNIHRVAKDFDFGSGCTLSITSPVNFRNFALEGRDNLQLSPGRRPPKGRGRVWVV